MPFEIIRNDIVNMQVDAIVNTANSAPVIGSGCDTGIHRKAGPALLEARKAVGHIAVGDAKITGGFGLNAGFVIHAVGPSWRGGDQGETQLLHRCYIRSLELAAYYQCESIAFPLMAAGNHGFPRELALQIAINAFRDFLTDHEMQIYLVVFGEAEFRLSEQRFRAVKSYIDAHYVQNKLLDEYGVEEKGSRREEKRVFFKRREGRREAFTAPEAAEMALPTAFKAGMPAPYAAQHSAERPGIYGAACPSEIPTAVAAPRPQQPSLQSLLESLDAGFSETLLTLIDQTGKKDSEIYKKANLSRQHFSKIRNNPSYKPTKETAVALALALELDLRQTRDLIGRAGYALSSSSKFDVIIMYFIERKIYNLFEINATLFEFDQCLLGA